MWYAARLLFESVHTGLPKQPLEEPREELFEEDIFLIQAENEELALESAREIGYNQEHSYANVYGETVTWRFAAVADLKELMSDEVGHGTEVYYRFIGRDQVDKVAHWSRPD